MISKVVEEAVSRRVVAFEGQENVSALPSPVEMVQLRVERMIDRKGVGIGSIGLGREAKGEADGLIFSAWDIAKVHAEAIFPEADEAVEVVASIHP